MDAKELIRRYNQGERNFEFINLFGKEFEELDLWFICSSNDACGDLPDYCDCDSYARLLFDDLNHPLSEEQENPPQFDLSNTNLEEINLKNAYLYRVNLYKSNLSGADLRYVKFIDANLTKTIFKKTDLRKAYIDRSNLSNADLYMARCEKTNFF